jgi:peptide methionine sulfoxide reductase MsrB
LHHFEKWNFEKILWKVSQSGVFVDLAIDNKVFKSKINIESTLESSGFPKMNYFG